MCVCVCVCVCLCVCVCVCVKVNKVIKSDSTKKSIKKSNKLNLMNLS